MSVQLAEIHTETTLQKRGPKTLPQTTEWRLVDQYFKYFEVIPATTSKVLEEVHSIRYRVYCVEHEFEDAAANPDGLERDTYDANSVHCLLRHSPTGWPAGTVRLVLPQSEDLENSLPLQEVCGERYGEYFGHLPPDTTAEVSRFCIAKTFRNRDGDDQYPGNSLETKLDADARRVIPNMVLGLFTSILRMSKENNITHCITAMEPALIRRLSRLGLDCGPVAEPFEYHGKRQPCAFKIETHLARCKAERPDIWEVVTERGRWA